MAAQLSGSLAKISGGSWSSPMALCGLVRLKFLVTIVKVGTAAMLLGQLSMAAWNLLASAMMSL